MSADSCLKPCLHVSSLSVCFPSIYSVLVTFCISSPASRLPLLPSVFETLESRFRRSLNPLDARPLFLPALLQLQDPIKLLMSPFRRLNPGRPPRQLLTLCFVAFLRFLMEMVGTLVSVSELTKYLGANVVASQQTHFGLFKSTDATLSVTARPRSGPSSVPASHPLSAPLLSARRGKLVGHNGTGVSDGERRQGAILTRDKRTQ